MPPQAAQAPERAVDDWEQPEDYFVALGRPAPSVRMAAHIAAIGSVVEGDPPRVAAGTPTVSVHLDGARIKIPTSWAIAYTSTSTGDVLLALDDDADALHLLRLGADGKLRELHGISDALLADLRAWRFPRGRR